MPTININTTNYYYELHGQGSLLVLISGLKSDHAGWLPVLDELTNHHQVLIFDNLGVGRTTDSGKSFTIEKMADDTMSLINALGLETPKIIGHSMGGAITQVIAKKYPSMISSIALCNTFIKFNSTAKEAFTYTLNVHQSGASQAEIMDTIIPWVFSKSFINPEIIDFIRVTSNENPYPQSLSGYQRQLQALCDFDSSAWIDSINVPTLVMGSEEDLVATPEESQALANNIKNSKLVMLPTAHASQVEKPALFINAINNFHSNYVTY